MDHVMEQAILIGLRLAGSTAAIAGTTKLVGNVMSGLSDVKDGVTDLDLVDMPEKVRIEVTGNDLRDLLYHTLDDFLFTYGAEYHISRRVEVVELDVDECTLVAYGYGERFSNDRHSQGTEISSVAPLVRSARTCDGKAATTDGLQIEESKGRVDCYVTAVIG